MFMKFTTVHSYQTRSVTNENQFKSALKGKLFEILEKEDYYIRISDIRMQFSKFSKS